VVVGKGELSPLFGDSGSSERESRFLTTHQHILGYTVSFTLYDLHKMDSRQLKMTGYSN